MKRFLILAFLLIPSYAIAQSLPKVFIEAQQGQSTDWDALRGVHTDNDLNTLPQIARQLQERAQSDGAPLLVVFEKEKADFVWILGREKKWNNNLYSWTLTNRATSTMLAYGSERLFQNCIKDTVKFVKISWQAMNLSQPEGQELAAKYPVTILFPNKNIRKGADKKNILRAVVLGTEAKASIKLLCLNPEIATLSDGNIIAVAETPGGPINQVDFMLAGTGKKGKCYFKAIVISVK